jgi:hypothetical protein
MGGREHDGRDNNNAEIATGKISGATAAARKRKAGAIAPWHLENFICPSLGGSTA